MAFDPISAGIGLVSGLLGSGGGSDGPDIPRWMRNAGKRTEFQPYTLRTGVGSTAGGFKKGGAPTVSIDPQLEALRQQGFGRAGGFFDRAGVALDRPVGEVTGFGNVDELTRQRFEQQRALLDPAFQQQQAQLKEGLFGSGRLGLQLAAQGAGAGGQGFVNPDAFGLARAQSQTLSEAAQAARQGALAEEGVRFDSGLRELAMNEQLQEQRQAGLLGMGSGMLGLGQSVSEMEENLIRLGLSAEAARSAASASAAGAGASALNAANQYTPTEGLGSQLLGAAVSGFAQSGGIQDLID